MKVVCKNCALAYDLDRALAGKKVECARCGYKFVVGKCDDVIKPDGLKKAAPVPSRPVATPVRPQGLKKAKALRNELYPGARPPKRERLLRPRPSLPPGESSCFEG